MIQSAERPRWWIDAALLVAFVALTVALINGHLLDLDQRVADWCVAHQPKVIYWPARVLNYLGQGGQVLTPLALLLTVWLTWRTRSVRALLPFIAANVLTYFTIGPLKIWADRAAPKFTGPDRAVFFNPYASGKYSVSYPSGHLGNSIIWYAVLAPLAAALLRRDLTRIERLAIRVAPPVIVFCTTVYTGFHWLTDSVAGVLLGLLLARILTRIPWNRVPLPLLSRWDAPVF